MKNYIQAEREASGHATGASKAEGDCGTSSARRSVLSRLVQTMAKTSKNSVKIKATRQESGEHGNRSDLGDRRKVEEGGRGSEGR